MPEPVGSIPRTKILENYRTITSLGIGASAAVRAAKAPLVAVDKVEISQEAREKLRQANQASREDSLLQEQKRKEQDEELKRSLEVLELGPEAQKDKMRRAYRHLMRSYHPDKYSHLPPEFRDLAEKKTRQIIEAYSKLNGENAQRCEP